jgi:hypothetical protein
MPTTRNATRNLKCTRGRRARKILPYTIIISHLIENRVGREYRYGIVLSYQFQRPRVTSSGS